MDNATRREREAIQLSSMDTSHSSTPDPTIGGGNEMSESIMEIIRPAVVKLDEQVKNTRKSQLLMANQIEQLSNFLKHITDDQPNPCDLDAYVRKLDESRRRVGNVSTRLQAIHERMGQLQRNIARETFKQKQHLKGTNAANTPPTVPD
jgi:hypothetical protein